MTTVLENEHSKSLAAGERVCMCARTVGRSAGDAYPPLAPGKLRLYNMRFCPFAERALLTLALKDIPYVCMFACAAHGTQVRGGEH
jgi:glutathionyl-hydroquinone reductase